MTANNPRGRLSRDGRITGDSTARAASALVAADRDSFQRNPMSAALPGPGPHATAPVRRFAFKGRVSTEDNQDPEASYNWQKSRSRALIEPAGGIIVAEYFDVGRSRSLPWKRRPRAAQLLADLADPGRGLTPW